MKVLCDGKEIDFKTTLEKGEVELDMYEIDDSDEEDTVDLTEVVENIKKEEIALCDTGEIKYE